jgi:hypothetical protein
MTIRTDLKTKLDANTFANNAALTKEPHIQLIEAPATVSAAKEGLIEIRGMNLVSQDGLVTSINKTYRINVAVSVDGQTADTKLMAIMDEIQSVLNTENNLVNRTYYYTMNYEWDGNVLRPELTAIIQAIEEYVSTS